MHRRSGWSAASVPFAVVLTCLAAPLSAQQVAAPAADAADASPDTVGLSEARDRLSVAVKIDGNGPYDFVVDTGAERTVISRELAAKLALEPAGSVMLQSMAGSGMVETAMIRNLLVSRKAVTDIRAPSLAAVHLGAAGMLGTDTLQEQRVLLDFANKKMTVSRSSRAKNSLGSDAIVVTARSLYGRLIVADARVEGEKVVIVIDTGADVSIGNNALRERLNKKQKLAPGVPITLVSVLGQSVTADYTQMKKITVGNVRLNNMPIAFSEVQLFKQLKLQDRPAILLGMDTLKLFNQVSIDFATKKVEFLSPYLSSGMADPTRLAMR